MGVWISTDIESMMQPMLVKAFPKIHKPHHLSCGGVSLAMCTFPNSGVPPSMIASKKGRGILKGCVNDFQWGRTLTTKEGEVPGALIMVKMMRRPNSLEMLLTHEGVEMSVRGFILSQRDPEENRPYLIAASTFPTRGNAGSVQTKFTANMSHKNKDDSRARAALAVSFIRRIPALLKSAMGEQISDVLAPLILDELEAAEDAEDFALQYVGDDLAYGDADDSGEDEGPLQMVDTASRFASDTTASGITGATSKTRGSTKEALQTEQQRNTELEVQNEAMVEELLMLRQRLQAITAEQAETHPAEEDSSSSSTPSDSPGREDAAGQGH